MLSRLFSWFTDRRLAAPQGTPFGIYPGGPPPVLQPSDFAYVGFYDVQPYGNDSVWAHGLTHRYVNGELRFLNYIPPLGAAPSKLQEWKIGSIPLGGKIASATAAWPMAAVPGLTSFTGLWYEQARERLWVTSGPDYTNQVYPSNIVTCVLGAGAITNIHTVSLSGINGKRVYGGACGLPSDVAALLGGRSYLVGFGGYTSLVQQGGGASIGPTAYALSDPDAYANGEVITDFRVVLDAWGSRGVRAYTPGAWPSGSPVNYFDGGDPRQNPSTRPSVPPLATAQWLSPNPQGQGWMTWGDSYYNTGMFISRNGKWAFALVASLVKGFGWYQTSTLAFDKRTFELHLFDPAKFNAGPLTRPVSLTDLALPVKNTVVYGGNAPIGNIAGATYDDTTGRLYLLGMAHTDPFTNRLYVFQVS